MSELGMSPSAIQVGREREDVVVGEEIVRHRMATRVVHWAVAVFFILCVFTGLPIWSPVFGWMAVFVGGLSVARWFHAWLGVAFVVASLFMFAMWLSDMRFDARDRGFKFVEYLRFSGAEDPEVGKYNG